MASYVGLDVLIPNILGTSNNDVESKKMVARRGYLERKAVFFDADFGPHVDSLISNDDDSTLTALIEEHQEETVRQFPLHKAALSGCFKTVRTLFKLLETPARVDGNGRTPLHMAAIGGTKEIIELFLNGDGAAKGPDMINSKDKNSQTPLILACRIGNAEVARQLAKSDAVDLSTRDNTSKAAIH